MTYLSQEQTTQIGQLLRERRRVLRNEIREGLLKSGEAHHKDFAGMVSDAGDESVANMLEDLEIAEVERDVRELREVENALARISRGDFGACADCGEPIGFPRLKANPAAVRCHPCQERRERGSAHERTPTL
ncbi:MAG TPA: TraR/DksA family transcriptional regulator [Burkholderiales bacterium]|nr:TraR/DksA family transcriptional regulator [Burkholderiales bacterium]